MLGRGAKSFMKDDVKGHQIFVNFLGLSYFKWHCCSFLLFWKRSPETENLARKRRNTYITIALHIIQRKVRKSKPEVYLLLLK